MLKNRYVFIILILFYSSFVHAEFESNCESLDDWQVLDMAGDGQAEIVDDPSVPPGYGKQVIEFKGKNIILFAKSQQMANGYIQVLWKDPLPTERDADGILMFRADFPQDVEYYHNTKERRPQYWIEQDEDSGTSLRYRDASIDDYTFDLAAGKGLTFDTKWNPTGWFWQKVKLDGENIYCKFWSVTEQEPKEWVIQAKSDNSLQGRYGVRCWSGYARIAHFISSDKDVTITPPTVFLSTPKHIILNKSLPEFNLYTNFQKAVQNCEILISLKHNNKTLKFKTSQNIPSGSFTLPLKEILAQSPLQIRNEGHYTLQIELTHSDGSQLGSDERTIEYRSNKELEAKINKLSTQMESFLNSKNANLNDPQTLKKKTAYSSALSLLGLAKERLDQGEQKATYQAVDYAEQLVNSADNLYHGQQHDGTYSLQFGDISHSSTSFVMGKDYTLSVPWNVTGSTINQDLQFMYHICNEYGQILQTEIINPAPATSTWKPGSHLQNITFSLPLQTPLDATAAIHMPKIFTGKHYLTVTVRDTTKKGPFQWVLLNNPESINYFNTGRLYTLCPVYITARLIEINALVTEWDKNTNQTHCTIDVTHYGENTLDAICAFDVQTETGNIVFSSFPEISLKHGKNQISLDYNIHQYGKLISRVRIIKDGSVLTMTEKEETIALPNKMAILVKRHNHVEKSGSTFTTPIDINLLAGKTKINSTEITVSTNEKELVQTTLSDKAQTTLQPTPNWGYYDLHFELKTNNGPVHYDKRIISTVAETQGTDILVNGEPFIMKGVNVHGLWGSSRALSKKAMEILKECGFNTLRGDHPNTWLVDLAFEENMCWMALADFSCASSEEIFTRYNGSPLAGIQEVSRQFVNAYKDNAGVLFWNSCNEIHSNLDEFLLTVYPAYKIYDPYNRPVNYANLYGQDNWRGQDIMGINYYFGLFQKSTDRQPIIETSINLGFEHNLPVIYTEYNSFWGPDELTGLDAIWGMGQWGLDKGMAGGTFYKLTDVPEHHPGLIDINSRFEIRQPMADAFKQFHADAAVKLISYKDQKVVLEIQNKRAFTLRNPVIAFKGISGNFTIDDIKPNEKKQIEISLSDTLPQQTLELDGELNFETHFGLKNNIDALIFLKP